MWKPTQRIHYKAIDCEWPDHEEAKQSLLAEHWHWCCDYTTVKQTKCSCDLIGRRLAPLEETAAPLVDAQTISVDVTDESSVISAFSLAGDFDILINNAGLVQSAPIKQATLEHWQQTIAVDGRETA